MNVARVIGTIWATRKHPEVEGATMLVIQPLSCDLDPIGRPLAAIDTVGAGEGELVYYVTAYEAVIPFFRASAPIDASIVGIIDHIDHDEDVLAVLSNRPPKAASPSTRGSSARPAVKKTPSAPAGETPRRPRAKLPVADAAAAKRAAARRAPASKAAAATTKARSRNGAARKRSS